MKSYTFADGCVIPAGETLASPGAIHLDDKVYPNARTFDGFRFSRMREQGEEGSKYYSVNTSTDFLSFGHGRHAW